MARRRAKKTTTRRRKVVRRGGIEHSHDPIRIVALHRPEPAAPSSQEPAAAATPALTYRGGPLLSTVEVFTIFWGSAWNTAPQLSLVRQLNQFFDEILSSSLIDQLAEYSVPKYTIGHGRRTGTITVTSPALRTSVADTAVQQMLQRQIATGKSVPKPTANTLYFVYVQPGVRVVQGGSASCQAFCGYHNAIAGAATFYAVMPYPGCSGCAGNLAVFDAMTATSSHELCEAITDPIPGQGWYDDTNGEIGDICAWQTKKIGNHVVQLEWSNRAGRCV